MPSATWISSRLATSAPAPATHSPAAMRLTSLSTTTGTPSRRCTDSPIGHASTSPTDGARRTAPLLDTPGTAIATPRSDGRLSPTRSRTNSQTVSTTFAPSRATRCAMTAPSLSAISQLIRGGSSDTAATSSARGLNSSISRGRPVVGAPGPRSMR